QVSLPASRAAAAIGCQPRPASPFRKESEMAIEFVDLKAQLAALRAPVNERIQKVLRHGQFIMGPEVVEMEERLAAYTGVKHCVSVASGTEALLITLMALGVERGAEVITTPFT